MFQNDRSSFIKKCIIEKQKSWGWTCEHSNPVESREPSKNELEQETISMIAD